MLHYIGGKWDKRGARKQNNKPAVIIHLLPLSTRAYRHFTIPRSLHCHIDLLNKAARRGCDQSIETQRSNRANTRTSTIHGWMAKKSGRIPRGGAMRLKRSIFICTTMPILPPNIPDVPANLSSPSPPPRPAGIAIQGARINASMCRSNACRHR